MKFRRFLNMLLALAMVVASSISAPMAVAAPSAQSGTVHGQMTMDAGHCEAMAGQSSNDLAGHHEKADQSCCAATCFAGTLIPAAAERMVVLTVMPPAVGPPGNIQGILAEIATPPPRHA